MPLSGVRLVKLVASILMRFCFEVSRAQVKRALLPVALLPVALLPVKYKIKLAQNKTGRALKAIDQLYLVAGAGFEPTTFGL